MTVTFQSVIAWQKAHIFVLDVYKTCAMFPNFERVGLCSQFQRAAVSIAANIAEGYKKLSKADKLRFFNISQGSIEECRYYTILAKDLGYIDSSIYERLTFELEETSKYLNMYAKGIIENNHPND